MTTTAGLADLLTLDEARRSLPGKPSLSCILRWVKLGLSGRDGTRIKLRAFRIGRRTYVKPVDILEFGAALARAHEIDELDACGSSRSRRGAGGA